jgi:hypothetical protein
MQLNAAGIADCGQLIGVSCCTNWPQSVTVQPCSGGIGGLCGTGCQALPNLWHFSIAGITVCGNPYSNYNGGQNNQLLLPVPGTCIFELGGGLFGNCPNTLPTTNSWQLNASLGPSSFYDPIVFPQGPGWYFGIPAAGLLGGQAPYGGCNVSGDNVPSGPYASFPWFSPGQNVAANGSYNPLGGAWGFLPFNQFNCTAPNTFSMNYSPGIVKNCTTGAVVSIPWITGPGSITISP